VRVPQTLRYTFFPEFFLFSIHVAALTDVGRVRTNNEDTFGIDSEHGLYLVCDGMGGAAAGEVASGMACSTTMESFAVQADHSEVFSLSEFEDRLSAAIRAANAAVYRSGRGDEHHNMGTTLVAAAVAGNTLLVGNVGDSRAYVKQQHGWQQLTSDHSYINELVQLGSIRAEDANAPELQRFASTITRAIGAAEEVHPEFFAVELNDGDTVLLCSDGLTRYLDAPEFDATIDSGDLEGSCRRLIDAAKELGGIDNITCMLLRYSDDAMAGG
jgi:serine/threonine protein phosphatase PrpC